MLLKPTTIFGNLEPIAAELSRRGASATQAPLAAAVLGTSTHAHQEPPNVHRTPPRVVVADDSAMMRQIVSTSLSRAGVQVVGSARNGDEALAVCERERPDALMLDLAMPGLDGIGVLRRCASSGRSDMPVVVVSAFSPTQGARAVDALAEGAFDLVAKPAVGEGLDGFAEAWSTKVHAATVGRRRVGATGEHVRRRRGVRGGRASRTVVLIATSTGGPRALAAADPPAARRSSVRAR